MRIFLSHAAEQRAQADRLAIALQTRGYHVFFDVDDLPAAGDYQSRIQQAINNCDLFCFLISPQSITAGRFTLSEIGLARKRWPDPTGRVVPIMVEKVPFEAVPAYLRAVSILEPQGDFVADSLAAISEIQPGRSRRWPRLAAGAAVIVLLGIGYAAYAHFGSRAGSGVPSEAPAGTRPPAGKPSASVSFPLATDLNDTVGRFGAYLTAIGFHRVDDQVTVDFYSKQFPLPGDLRDQSSNVNAFYQDGKIYIHWDLASDKSVVLREYTHHVLSQNAGAGATIGNSDVESGLADYLPATFLDSPLIGQGLGPLFKLPTTYIRSVDNDTTYTGASVEAHARGEAWAGALWACRQSLGKNAIDPLPAVAWRSTFATVDTRTAPARFGAALAAGSTSASRCLAQEMRRRSLPH
jgi:hypothetical protein